MSCERVQERISSLVDRELPVNERADVLAHIETCRQCGARLESIESVRAALRHINRGSVPAQLTARLRVIASHERARQLSRMSFSARLQFWRERIRLCFDNLMRPVALPVAGGSLSALMMFSLLVPSLSFPHNISDQMLFTHPEGELVTLDAQGTFVPLVGYVRIVRADAAIPVGANAVELTIDRDGRVTEASLTRGTLTPELQSIIIMSRFQPATFMGLPMHGKVKIIQTITLAPITITVRS